MTDARHRRSLTLALVATVLLAGCGGGGQSVPGVTDSTITLGSWAPLTGPAALWGAVGRGVQGYFRMINETEGGINGRKINVILRDDGYQPSRTVTAVREMAERDGVFAFVGGVGTAPGLAVKDYLEEQGIPFITPASGNATFTHPPSPVIFSTFALYVDEAAALVEYAVDSLGLSRLAVIYQNDDFGPGTGPRPSPSRAAGTPCRPPSSAAESPAEQASCTETDSREANRSAGPSRLHSSQTPSTGCWLRSSPCPTARSTDCPGRSRRSSAHWPAGPSSWRERFQPSSARRAPVPAE